MEENKENFKRWNTKTQIPVSVGSLPALSTYLLQKKNQRMKEKKGDEVRLPLRTLNTSPLAGSSGTHESMKQRHPLKIDTKYVTLRQRNEELDWGYQIFKEDMNDNNSIIIISDDESFDKNDKNNYDYFTEQGDNSLGETSRAITPVPKPSALEPIGVRNVKRSLKRPHSRELQGLSPVAQPKEKEEKFKRRLNFNECFDDASITPDYFKKCYTKCIEKDYALDLFSYLMTIERRGLLPGIPSVTRACIINWLMRVDGRGSPEVIQTACWYFDSLLHFNAVPLEYLQTVAAACFWISMKLHGPVSNASKLVKCSNKAFSSKQLMEAERAILQKLKYPSQPIIPQEYITYLSWCLDDSHRGEIALAATFLCMTGMMVDKSLCTEYPSVIAAACVRNAALLLRKRDSMRKLQMSPIYQAAEKKATNMCAVCTALRRAVCVISNFSYEYKAPLEHYGQAPGFIAQKIIRCAKELAIIDAKCTESKESLKL